MKLSKKQPVQARLTIDKFVVPEIADLASDSRYDTQVLLWMQERFVQQAMAERMPELMDAVQESLSLPEDEGEAMRMGTLARFTVETYAAEKQLGRGVDLKAYLAAAEVYFETEAVKYGAHLRDVADEIKDKLDAGQRPDIDRLSRTVYGAAVKLSATIDSLETLNKQCAEAVVQRMQEGVKRIEMVAITDSELNVGRVLFKAIETIAQAPEKYMQFKDPRTMEMPIIEPWDYEPIPRSDSLSF